jgi:oligosaccharide amylase
MPRQLAIGNGKMLVNLDQHSFIRDIYYPFVGQLNHVGGHYCRVGVWVDGSFAWLNDPAWDINLAYVSDSLVTNVTMKHEALGIELHINDGVHQREHIFLKKIQVTNLTSQDREVRIFFHQDLVINENEVGDTAAYYPLNHTVFHYKKDKYFMFNGRADNEGIFEYTAGVKRFNQAEGTWRDAEDGTLMENPIAQGSVDSTISFKLGVPAHGQNELYYWFSVGRTLEEVKSLDAYVKTNQPGKILDRIKIYWQRWVNKEARFYGNLNDEVVSLYKHSLLMVRTQTNLNGAIIAANDTDIMAFNRDHYSYMWPRDGALIAYAMSMAGYQGMIVPFFHFCADALSSEGYLAHKYNPDGTIGSSWHPYIHNGEFQLPIQEDETGLVLFALWEDFAKNGVIELPQSLYSRFIRKAAKFLSEYIDEDLSLPKPSYDLWEERYGIFTFTCSAVYGGLMAAANFCSFFGDDERGDGFRSVAQKIKAGMLEHLWDEETGRFARGIIKQEGQWVKDMTLETSVYGIFEFGVLPADDPRVVSTMSAIKEGLSVKTDIGGIARYHNDYYFQSSNDLDNIPGNPWIICTLWLAEWEIEKAKSLEDLEAPRRTLEWVVDRSMESGVLPEQINPFDGSPISVAPLTWSHATYVLAVSKYMKKYKQING